MDVQTSLAVICWFGAQEWHDYTTERQTFLKNKQTNKITFSHHWCKKITTGMFINFWMIFSWHLKVSLYHVVHNVQINDLGKILNGFFGFRGGHLCLLYLVCLKIWSLLSYFSTTGRCASRATLLLPLHSRSRGRRWGFKMRESDSVSFIIVYQPSVLLEENLLSVDFCPGHWKSERSLLCE